MTKPSVFRTEVVIYVLERPVSGPAKRVKANDLYNVLGQGTARTQVTSQLNVESMMPKVGWTPEQLKEYLEKPPAGKKKNALYTLFIL